MKKLTSKEIKKLWIDFFKSKKHEFIESASLVPIKDPSLLWINSGVATLKDFFSGKKKPNNPRIVNSQKVIRTNDIDNIGVTARHHSFFEMLGNFSIGDYFKNEALDFAIEFIFNVLKFERKDIYITYYEEDKETKEMWIAKGINPKNLIGLGKDTNFWDMGQGPCGPNTEIFIDRGVKYELLQYGEKEKGIKLLEQDLDNDRYIELWNIVFSTYNNDGEGNYTELSQKNIDTGAGLERIACVLQGALTNYESDLFLPIIKELEKHSKFKYDINNFFIQEKKQYEINKAYKIISDHLRTVAHAISDSAKPSNVSRGYVLRSLIRRSLVSLKRILQVKEKYVLGKIINVIDQQSDYDIDVELIENILIEEEDSFEVIVAQGKKLVLEIIEKKGTFDTYDAFKMFETHGFPVQFARDILENTNIKKEDNSKFNIDDKLLHKLIQEHIEKSRSGNKVAMQKSINSLHLIQEKVSKFVGYNLLDTKSKIVHLFDDENEIEYNNDGISYVVLDKTPFYATAGGQRHDKGFIKQGENVLKVLDVFKDKFFNHIHLVKGKINNRDTVNAIVDRDVRVGLERNHSATHLLFWALRNIFGTNIIKQLGSDNNEERLTFDFPLNHKPTKEEVKKLEKLINDVINKDIDRIYHVTTLEKAIEMDTIMTLEEQEYVDPNEVRIVEFTGITKDLCGGNHIHNTRFIEGFKIVTVENKGSGTFRIRAITSKVLIDKLWKHIIANKSNQLKRLIKQNNKLDKTYSSKNQFEKSFESFEEEEFYLNKTILKVRNDFKKLQKQSSSIDVSDFVLKKHLNFEYIFKNDVKSNQVKVLSAELREKFQNALIVIVAPTSDKAMITVASKRYDSKLFSILLFEKYSGRGGGNKILVQGSIEKKINEEEFIQLIEEFNA